MFINTIEDTEKVSTRDTIESTWKWRDHDLLDHVHIWVELFTYQETNMILG